jgi:hypothetical protein
MVMQNKTHCNMPFLVAAKLTAGALLGKHWPSVTCIADDFNISNVHAWQHLVYQQPAVHAGHDGQLQAQKVG